MSDLIVMSPLTRSVGKVIPEPIDTDPFLEVIELAFPNALALANKTSLLSMFNPPV